MICQVADAGYADTGARRRRRILPHLDGFNPNLGCVDGIVIPLCRLRDQTLEIPVTKAT